MSKVLKIMSRELSGRAFVRISSWSAGCAISILVRILLDCSRSRYVVLVLVRVGEIVLTWYGRRTGSW